MSEVFIDPRSTSIERAEYFEAEENMIVTFKSGDEYKYYDVPYDEFKKMCQAPSSGKYFYANIRDQYEYDKL